MTEAARHYIRLNQVEYHCVVAKELDACRPLHSGFTLSLGAISSGQIGSRCLSCSLGLASGDDGPYDGPSAISTSDAADFFSPFDIS